MNQPGKAGSPQFTVRKSVKSANLKPRRAGKIATHLTSERPPARMNSGRTGRTYERQVGILQTLVSSPPSNVPRFALTRHRYFILTNLPITDCVRRSWAKVDYRFLPLTITLFPGGPGNSSIPNPSCFNVRLN